MMEDINGYVNDIEDDRLVVTLGLDILNEINKYSEGDKVKVTFEYEINEPSNDNEIILEEKEMAGEVITIHDEANCMDVKFEAEVPKNVDYYDNVEVIKISEEGSQIE